MFKKLKVIGGAGNGPPLSLPGLRLQERGHPKGCRSESDESDEGMRAG